MHAFASTAGASLAAPNAGPASRSAWQNPLGRPWIALELNWHVFSVQDKWIHWLACFCCHPVLKDHPATAAATALLPPIACPAVRRQQARVARARGQAQLLWCLGSVYRRAYNQADRLPAVHARPPPCRMPGRGGCAARAVPSTVSTCPHPTSPACSRVPCAPT